MNDPMILVDGLSKTYGRTTAVSGLNFQVEAGECFGLVGPNGAGKTTSINMIAGMLSPTAGNVHIAGVSLATNPRQAKANMGLVPQDFALYPALSGRDNLLFFGRLYGLWGRALAERVHYALETVRLSDRSGMTVSAYSNGMKRRLNLAAGLLHDPVVLILDEPTVGIDMPSRQTIITELKALIRSGKTVLYCTHHLSETEELCSRVAIMDSGRIIAIDTTRELVHQHGTGIIQVEFSSPPDNRLLQFIQQLGVIRPTSDRSKGIQIQSTDPNTALESMLKCADECGNAIRTVQLLEPNLETVFLNLTGRSIKD